MNSMDTFSSNEYSASSTVITLETPIPLLRGPLPSESGHYVLAFRDPHSWANSFRSSHRNILNQCHQGAKIGCAITASSKCKPPWWNLLLPSKPHQFKQRELCEEQEMRECFHLAKDKCLQFSKDKCFIPFRDARVKALGVKDGIRLLNLASMNQSTRFPFPFPLPGQGFGVTNCRASELLGFDDWVECIFGERGEEDGCFCF